MEEAEANLKKALEINPSHPVTLNEYALLYRETGRYAEAKQLYQQLVERYPQFMPARKNYGVLCELYLNDKECAISQYEVYLGKNPQDEDVKLWLTGLQR
jgi:tetratricopeptide (TPR) repeat protein